MTKVDEVDASKQYTECFFDGAANNQNAGHHKDIFFHDEKHV